MVVWAVQGYSVFMYNRRITFSDSDDPRPIPWRYGLSRATQYSCITDVSRLVTLMTHDPYHGGMGCPGLLSIHV